MDVIEANKIISAKAADSYDKLEPHFSSENKIKVKKILKNIRQKSGSKLLDLGCGTGFIINLAKDLFDEIHGIDISDEMLKKVDTSSSNIILYNCMVEKLPFENEYFDVVSAYAVLHHLENYEKALYEAFRVLKKNGYLYIGLEPNKNYFDLVAKYKEQKDSNYSEIVKKEILSICYAKEKIEKDYGIDGDIFNLSEYTKSFYSGFDAKEFQKIIKKIGFNKCEVFYEWYPGQGRILHQQSESDALIIDNYLQKLMPFSKCFYKYLKFIIIK